jgi:predicted nucleic acid-binding protein
MMYLLDVNALVALGVMQHQFHERVTTWVQSESTQRGFALATTAITELGFVRILSQVQEYQLSIADARLLLLSMKSSVIPWRFVKDGNDISRMPSWVETPRQTTDGHLVQLAEDHRAKLATLDEHIPGGFLIPEDLHDFPLLIRPRKLRTKDTSRT